MHPELQGSGYGFYGSALVDDILYFPAITVIIFYLL